MTLKSNQNKFAAYLIFACLLMCYSCKGETVKSVSTSPSSEKTEVNTKESENIKIDQVNAAKDAELANDSPVNSSIEKLSVKGNNIIVEKDNSIKDKIKDVKEDVKEHKPKEEKDVKNNNEIRDTKSMQLENSNSSSASQSVLEEKIEVVETNTNSVKSTVQSQKENTPTDKDLQEKTADDPPEESGMDMHTELDKLLKTHVSSSGKVDYKGIKGDQDRLENYLALISNNKPGTSASKDEKLVYWINVYNAYTIKLIVDNYPIKSITDLDGGKPWDKKWINIKGTKYSLNQIENEIIRPTFNEPRIHFAVNCAAKSCPPLMNKAWNASSLDADLENATKAFITNNAYNSIQNGNAQISKIFDWYKEDFGDVKKYIAKYSGQEVKEVSFKEYDWSLNN